MICGSFVEFLRRTVPDGRSGVSRGDQPADAPPFLEIFWDRGIAKRSIARKLACLRSFFRYLQKTGVVHSLNPTATIVSPQARPRASRSSSTKKQCAG